MAHKEQWVFCGKVKGLHPEYFENKKVLDIGSFDVNGNEEFLFKNCDFTGLDIGEGDGVDVVCPAQDYDEPDETFDTIISCECWEHNPFYAESILNAIRMLKSGGLFSSLVLQPVDLFMVYLIYKNNVLRNMIIGKLYLMSKEMIGITITIKILPKKISER